MTEMMRVTAALFDFDGTLVTLEIDFPLMRRRVNEIIASFGVPSHILTAPFSWERIEQAAAWLAKFDQRKAEHLEKAAKAIIVQMEDEAAQIAAPPPDVLPTLHVLKAKGIKLALVTRNSMRAVQSVLRRHQLPFDAIVTRDHVQLLKPNPEHLISALRRLGINSPIDNPSSSWHCAFVGDHPADVHAALRVGLMPVGIARNDEAEKELKKAGAFVVVRRFYELGLLLTR